jgi:hypothetical protein
MRFLAGGGLIQSPLAMVYFLIKEGREAVEEGCEVLVKTNKN